MLKHVVLIISGDVQGVGYRSFLQKNAKKLGCVGTVKNREDGSVEAHIQAEENVLQEMVRIAGQGPDVSWVSGVAVHDMPLDLNLISFDVLY